MYPIPKPIRLAINGFGRIGRLVTRVALLDKKLEVIAINNPGADAKDLALLLKYDSIHGKFELPVTYNKEFIQVGKKKIKVINENDPEKLPWKKLKVDIVIECTGKFLTKETVEKHIKAGAKKVVLSAPPKSSDIKTYVVGVNDYLINKKEKIISNASCTTNCFAPMVMLLNKHLGIKHGYMVTIHAYTSDQRIHDGTHDDYRRGRAAALNMVPTSTGSAKAVAEVLPEMKGKLHASAIRVPVPDGSLTYFTCEVKKKKTANEINALFKKEAQRLKGILQYAEEPLVSSDIVHNPHSCVFDSLLTEVDGDLVKVVAWYDNEWGYSNRVIDLVKKAA